MNNFAFAPSRDNDKYKATVEPPIEQHVISDQLDSSQLKLIVFFIIGFYFSIFLPFFRVPGGLVQEPGSFETARGSRQRVDFYTELTNISDENVYAYLQYKFVQEVDVDHKPATWNVKVDGVHYNYDNKVMYETENRVWHRWLLNASYLPLHYIPIRNITRIQVHVVAEAQRDWLETVQLKWEFGNPEAFIIAKRIHLIFFILYVFCIIHFTYRTFGYKQSTRAFFVSIILPISAISQLPLEYFGVDIHVSNFIRNTAGSVSFLFSFMYWRVKGLEFNVVAATTGKKFKPMVACIVMGCYGIFETISNYINLFSFPSDPGSADPDESDFTSKNIWPIILLYSYYGLIVDLFDRLDRKEGEELNHFMMDNAVFYFASVFCGLLNIQTMKKKNLVRSPVLTALSNGLWDLVVFYEAFASPQVADAEPSAVERKRSGPIEFDIDEFAMSSKRRRESSSSEDDGVFNINEIGEEKKHEEEEESQSSSSDVIDMIKRKRSSLITSHVVDVKEETPDTLLEQSKGYVGESDNLEIHKNGSSSENISNNESLTTISPDPI